MGTSFIPEQGIKLGGVQLRELGELQKSYQNSNSAKVQDGGTPHRRKLKAKKTKVSGHVSKIANQQQAQAAMHVLKNNQQVQQNINFPHQQINPPNQQFGQQPFNGQMVHGQMLANGSCNQQMVHPQHKALLTPSPSANLTAGPHNQQMLQHSQMVANQIMTNYQQNSHPQMVRNQQMVPNQPFVQQNMVHNKQMVPPNGHINQQVPMNHSQMQPVDPNQPRPIVLNPEPAPNGPNNGPQVGCTYQQGQNNNQQQNNGRQIPSECKYQNGEIQKGDKNYCSCCYCEFFGNGAPVQAPLPKNYIENRDRLRKKLNKKQSNEPQSSRGNSSEQNRDLQDMQDLDELCNFIEGGNTEKKKNKKKKKNNNQQNEPPVAQEKDLYDEYFNTIGPELKHSKDVYKYTPIPEKATTNPDETASYDKMSAQNAKKMRFVVF